MTIVFGAQGVQPTLRGQPSNLISLSAGQTFNVPAGTWNLVTGLYTTTQELDPITGIWRAIGRDDSSSFRYINSDGANYRLANQTGCVVGVAVKNAGSGYTSAPAVSDNGTSNTTTYQAIVGGAVSGTFTIANGGKNYLYPPSIQISAPGNPGVQATATCTISAGAVNAITITNQGAGYTSVPTVTVVNDIRDTTGINAQITAALTGSGTITAVLVTNHGIPLTSVPTIAFAGGGGTGATADALMNFTTTAYTVTSAGSGYVGNVLISGFSAYTTATSYTNPAIQSGLVRMRPAYYGGALSSTGVTTAAQVLYDGGIGFTAVPTGYVAGGYNSTGAFPISAAQVTFTCGGVSDTSFLTAV